MKADGPDVLALPSAVGNDQKPDGVRALECPVCHRAFENARKLEDHLMLMDEPRDKINLLMSRSRLQSANAGRSQPVETGLESANNKGG